MQPPITFLYYIENAYINHRKYLSSYSPDQLQGNILFIEGNLIDENKAKAECIPFVYNKDMNKTNSWSGKPLDPDAIASPCGFKGLFLFTLAFLYFNDTFQLKKI
jgi:hypothetical protein